MKLINSDKFEKVNASTLSYLSFLSYQSEDVFREAIPSNEVHFIEDKKTGTQCFVVIDDENIVVVFRGTEGTDIKDWATNLDAEIINDEYHSGFDKAYSSIHTKITDLIEDTIGANVYITGHSLGGALANLCFWDHEEYCETIKLYTFGSPRVFSKNTSEELNSGSKAQAFRIVNNNDVVTRVPPRNSGYSHFGTLIYIDTGKNIIHDNDLTWWGLFWNRVVGRVEDCFELGTDGIKDHSIGEYWDAFK